MTTYQIVKHDGVSALQYLKRDGSWSDVARLIDTPKNKLLLVDAIKFKSLRFKSDTPIVFMLQGNYKVATITSENIKAYTLPHHTHYHYEVMQASRNMHSLASTKYMQSLPDMRDAMTVDYDGILDNMLDYIGTL